MRAVEALPGCGAASESELRGAAPTRWATGGPRWATGGPWSVLPYRPASAPIVLRGCSTFWGGVMSRGNGHVMARCGAREHHDGRTEGGGTASRLTIRELDHASRCRPWSSNGRQAPERLRVEGRPGHRVGAGPAPPADLPTPPHFPRVRTAGRSRKTSDRRAVEAERLAEPVLEIPLASEQPADPFRNGQTVSHPNAPDTAGAGRWSEASTGASRRYRAAAWGFP